MPYLSFRHDLIGLIDGVSVRDGDQIPGKNFIKFVFHNRPNVELVLTSKQRKGCHQMEG
jgi:hypothetical protein